VRDCRELGLQSEIVTNGFWGATLSGARDLLASLREADRQGSRAFLRMGKPASALPERDGHPCHVCGTLLETYSRAELEDAISSYYADHPSGLPESIIDLLPPSRVDRAVPVESSSSSIVVG
jgi:hypothetical protein